MVISCGNASGLGRGRLGPSGRALSRRPTLAAVRSTSDGFVLWSSSNVADREERRHPMEFDGTDTGSACWQRIRISASVERDCEVDSWPLCGELLRTRPVRTATRRAIRPRRVSSSDPTKRAPARMPDDRISERNDPHCLEPEACDESTRCDLCAASARYRAERAFHQDKCGAGSFACIHFGLSSCEVACELARGPTSAVAC